MLNVKQAACVLIIKNGKILAVSRRNNHSDFGLPGGKVDPGETIEEAAVRELKEETGLDIKNLKPIFSESNNGYYCTTFTGDISGNISSEEDAVIAWVDPYTLCKGSFGEYNSLLLKRMKSFND